MGTGNAAFYVAARLFFLNLRSGPLEGPQSANVYCSRRRRRQLHAPDRRGPAQLWPDRRRGAQARGRRELASTIAEGFRRLVFSVFTKVGPRRPGSSAPYAGFLHRFPTCRGFPTSTISACFSEFLLIPGSKVVPARTIASWYSRLPWRGWATIVHALLLGQSTLRGNGCRAGRRGARGAGLVRGLLTPGWQLTRAGT